MKKLLFSILAGALALGCDPADSGPVSLSVPAGPVTFDNRGGTVEGVEISSSHPWRASLVDPNDAGWMTFTPAEGSEGATEIVVVALANDGDTARTAEIRFTAGDESRTLTVSQAASTLTLSTDLLEFGPAGDTRMVGVTTDASTWRISKPTGGTWLTATKDGGGITVKVSGNFEETPREVTLGIISGGITRELKITQAAFDPATHYADGQVIRLQEAETGDGVDLVLMGDGYVFADMTKGGNYEKLMREAADHFFSVWPFTEYRDRFDVWMVAAVSDEAGITDTSSGKKVDTAFATTWAGLGSTQLACNRTTAENYAAKAASAAGKSLDRMTVIMPVAMADRAGTSWFKESGFSIALCPAGPSFFRSMIRHEVCGHGFAKLADEYQRSGQPNESDKAHINAAQASGIYLNIDVESGGDATKTLWADFVGKPGYEEVGAFEGAFQYDRGIWRSEDKASCMDNETIEYFNAPSRWAQLRRIMALSGEYDDLTIDEFIALDEGNVR